MITGDKSQPACPRCGSVLHDESFCLKKELFGWLQWGSWPNAVVLDGNFIRLCRERLSHEQRKRFVEALALMTHDSPAENWSRSSIFALIDATPEQQAKAILEALKEPAEAKTEARDHERQDRARLPGMRLLAAP